MLNRITIMGRLVSDPELNTSSAGNSYTRFTIACQRDFAKSGEEKATDFIDCSAFGRTAEFVSKYFAKGKMITLEGRLVTGSYEKNGEKRKSYSINIDNVYFSGDKSDNTLAKSEAEEAARNALMSIVDFSPISADDEDLPF